MAGNNNAEKLARRAQRHAEARDFVRARAALRRAIRQQPGNAALHYQLARIYRDLGETKNAAIHFRKTLQLEPAATTAYYNYCRTRTFSADDPIIEQIHGQLERLDRAGTGRQVALQRAELLFALGKIADDCGDIDRAFEHWREANSLVRGTIEYDSRSDRARLEAIKRLFDDEFIKSRQLTGAAASAPIFIVGVPRSGSTLCEQILASHSEVTGKGELMFLPNLLGEHEKRTGIPYPDVIPELSRSDLIRLRERYLELATGQSKAQRFTDKLPINFWLTGLIAILFPEARIIDVRRDRIDTALSCFRHLFAEGQKFAYDLDDIRRYQDIHGEMMDHWHKRLPTAIHTLSYEDLVNDPEATVRELLDFCGLQFEPACIEFQNTKRAVLTSSAAQVRQPLHSNAIRSSMNYQRYLRDHFSGTEFFASRPKN